VPKKGSEKDRFSWEVDFIRCELHKANKEALAKYDLELEATFDTITRLVSDGYKLSVSSDKIHNCVGAYLTSPKSDSGARQRCMGGRGPDVFGALRCLAFKHNIVLGGDWANAQSADWENDAWG